MRNTAVDNEELARLATAGRAVRGRRQNRLLLAKLLSSGSEEEDDEGDGEMAEDAGARNVSSCASWRAAASCDRNACAGC